MEIGRTLILASMIITIGLSGGLSGCGGSDSKPKGDIDEFTDPDVAGKTAEQLMEEGEKHLAEKNYKRSIKMFDAVDQQFPYSKLAPQAILRSGETSFQATDYGTALSTLQRFMQLYPNNPKAPYALHVIARCYYDQIADVGRDQGITAQARQVLGEVINRYPNTDYATDARYKLDLVDDHLAGKEMEVGRYYLAQHEWLAAINRFKMVVTQYQTTTHIQEALHRLVEANLSLGLVSEAQGAAAVLGKNYPDSPWYKDSYALLNRQNLKPDITSGTSWWSRLLGRGDTAKAP